MKNLFDHLKMARKGQTLIASLIIAITIASIMLANVAMPVLTGANQTGWSATDITMFGMLSTFLILALLVAIAKAAGFM